MVILGINDGHHAGAALVVDGVLVSAVSEERLSRNKCEYGYPERAIAECLRLGGLDRADVTRVAVATKSLPPKYFMTKRNTTFRIEDYWREQTEYWYPRIYEKRKVKYTDVFADHVRAVDFPYDLSLIAHEDDGAGMRTARHKHIARMLRLPAECITFYDHQGCHAYYAYLCHRDREKPLLVATADGFGDSANGSLWIGEPHRPLREIMRSGLCNIGRLYRYMTLLLGMKPNEHEYKVMGLAPYATEATGRLPYAVFSETLAVDGLQFNYKVKPKDNFFHFKDRLQACRFDGIAHGLQRHTEEVLDRWIGNAVRETGLADVVFAGGVALNVKANKRLWEQSGVDSLFVPPGANDESMPIAAAFYAFAEACVAETGGLDGLAPFETAYLGGSYTDQEIERTLDATDLPPGVTVRRAGVREQAEILARGDVLARFAGRMEFGPRALGNRSILADPRRTEVVHVINTMIKMRDFWMPFCPSILRRRAGDYLANPKSIDDRFMTVAFDSTVEGRRDLPATLHPSDKTARPQVVSPDDNPGYHDLIAAFEDLTGVGCLLNTSFNLHGEPIVATPEDALNTFARSGLTHLQLGGWLVSKNGKLEK
jgi:carbamoyltransferase